MPSSDSGTATLGMVVADPLRRNRKTTSTTRAIESNSVSWMSRNEARMVVVRSSTTEMSMAGEMEARSSGISAVTRSTVSMMFVPG